MDELISRQKVLEYLSRLIVNVGRSNGKGVFTRMLSDYVEYVKGLPSEKKANDWIPCSERLPETDNWRTTFIVTTDNGKTKAMEWENTTVRNKPVTRWIWHDVISPWNVVAWMPLPEPHKEEKK